LERYFNFRHTIPNGSNKKIRPKKLNTLQRYGNAAKYYKTSFPFNICIIGFVGQFAKKLGKIRRRDFKVLNLTLKFHWTPAECLSSFLISKKLKEPGPLAKFRRFQKKNGGAPAV